MRCSKLMVALSFSVVLTTGCGQGPALTKEAGQAAATSQSPAQASKGAGPGLEKSDAKDTKLENNDPKPTDPKPTDPKPAEVKPAETAPKVVETKPQPPVAPVVVVVAAEKGANGTNGIDGANGISGCKTNSAESQTFPAERMVSKDRKKWAAPLRDTKVRAIPRLSLGDTSKPNVQYVLDSMVFFGFHVKLPALKYVRVKKALLTLELTKIMADCYPWTEWISLLDEKISSGVRYEASNYLANNNPKYPEMSNDAFSEIIRDIVAPESRHDDKTKPWCKPKTHDVYPATVTITLDDILRGSKYGTAHEYLYRKAAQSEPLELAIPIAVGDDSRVTTASLTIEWEEDTCASGKGAQK
ncbi:MAG: hypothetical protein HY075_01160 [Deltaproteobacteria bacterium]|nr:hypothetical protein [Deltaproteobacteria bacterium]